jgi:hypothetical protein
MVNTMLMADAIEDLAAGRLIARAVSELGAIIGQHGVKREGHGGDYLVGVWLQLAGPVGTDD